ncbi:single-stranded DNA-binding protein [Faecalimicrobium sp. JNUCC 81]
MNSVTLTGRLSKEPTLKYLEGSGASVAKFDLAVNKEYSKEGDSKAEFFTIECWNKLAESVVNNLDTGRKVLVEGFLKTNTWSDANNKAHKIVLVIAKRIEYLDYPKNTAEHSEGFEPVNMDLVEGELPF